jgi:hypothetical protein
MAPHHYVQSASREAKIALAMQAINSDASLPERQAALTYVDRRTSLQNRRQGKTHIRDYTPVGRKLTKQEERAIVRYIFELDTRGLTASKRMVRDMADDLPCLKRYCKL